MTSSKDHLGQIRKNWSIIALLLTIVFGAGVAWAFTQKEYVEQKQFDFYIASDTNLTEQRFKDLNTLLTEKFLNVNERIADLDDHMEELKDLIREQ